MKTAFATLMCVAIAAVSGCSSLDKNKTAQKDDSWSITKLWKKEYQEPTSLAAIWSPDSLATPGNMPERGFGGRIFFYNARSQAVPVDGDLVVHAYLTTPGVNEGQVASDKKFEFAAERLASHFSPSQIGASYSVWIPWDDATDGMREEVTLIATFKSKQGSVVQGAPAKVFLPGKSRGSDSLPSPSMQTVSYQREILPTYSQPEPEPSQVVRTRTTTIEVPDDATFIRAKRKSLILGGQGQPGTSGSTEPASSGVRVGGGERLTPLSSTPSPGAATAPVKAKPATPSSKSTGPTRAESLLGGERKRLPLIQPRQQNSHTTPSGIDLKTIMPPPSKRGPVNDPLANL